MRNDPPKSSAPAEPSESSAPTEPAEQDDVEKGATQQEAPLESNMDKEGTTSPTSHESTIAESVENDKSPK